MVSLNLKFRFWTYYLCSRPHHRTSRRESSKSKKKKRNPGSSTAQSLRFIMDFKHSSKKVRIKQVYNHLPKKIHALGHEPCISTSSRSKAQVSQTQGYVWGKAKASWRCIQHPQTFQSQQKSDVGRQVFGKTAFPLVVR